MSRHLSTPRFIKTGRSKNPFLLFIRNRKGHKNQLEGPLPNILTGLLFAVVIATLAVFVYAFISGKLG
jgi:hypothetical protein